MYQELWITGSDWDGESDKNNLCTERVMKDSTENEQNDCFSSNLLDS